MPEELCSSRLYDSGGEEVNREEKSANPEKLRVWTDIGRDSENARLTELSLESEKRALIDSANLTSS